VSSYYLFLHRYQEAEEFFRSALGVSLEYNSQLLAAGSHGNLGQALLIDAQFSTCTKPEGYTPSALKASLENMDLIANEIKKQLCEQALEHLDSGISIIEDVRGDLTQSFARASFFEGWGGLYSAAAECCLHLGRIQDALVYSERSRSKTLAEAVGEHLEPRDRQLSVRLRQCRHRALSLGLLPSRNRQQDVRHLTGSDNYERRARMQALEEYHDIVEECLNQDPSFAEGWKNAEVKYLRESADYRGLLKDDRSCLLEFLWYGKKKLEGGRLRAFLITRQAMRLVTFPDESMNQLQEIWEKYLRLYITDKTINLPQIIEDTCRSLHEYIFGGPCCTNTEPLP
jgi:tetratricopeptide (TPR) repeat protein